MRILIPAIIAAATFAPTLTTLAEPIIYQGIRYQYGTHGEIFYGGVHPQYLPNNYPVANTPATQALADHFGFPNPNYHSSIFNSPVSNQYPSLIYSDLVPYDEAGHLGFRIDDARNEAYLNAPRYFRGSDLAPAQPPAAQTPEPRPSPIELTPSQQRAKAIPLLSWARSDSAKKNPELQRALLDEAAKYAPEDTAKARAELGF